MVTSSHAYWTWRASRSRPGAGWAVLGGIAPDLPALAAVVVLTATGTARGELLGAVYHRPGLDRLHLAVHAAWIPLALLALGRRRPSLRRVGGGWLGHLGADYLLHHDDAWPPAWPLSRRRWRSPVSYWQPDHHAHAWSATELAVIALATAGDRSAAGWVAGALALATVGWTALASRGGNLWTSLGARPDPGARGRDLQRR